MSRTKWLQARRYNVTATDIAGILGECKYGTKPYDILMRKLDLSKFVENGFTRFGTDAEGVVATVYTERYGWDLYDDGELTMVQHPHYPWATATLDRWVQVMEESVCPAEIKTGTWRTMPKNYYWQCQWQMFVTNTRLIPLIQSKVPGALRVKYEKEDVDTIFKWVREAEMVVHPVHRNDDDIQRAFQAACEFRHTVLQFLRDGV
jgi:putative phage-type endonuclease